MLGRGGRGRLRLGGAAEAADTFLPSKGVMRKAKIGLVGVRVARIEDGVAFLELAAFDREGRLHWQSGEMALPPAAGPLMAGILLDLERCEERFETGVCMLALHAGGDLWPKRGQGNEN